MGLWIHSVGVEKSVLNRGVLSSSFGVLQEQTLIHIKCVRKTETMKKSLLLLTALSIALLLHASRHTHASDLSQLLDKEIRDLKDEIEKRGKKRKPCGFTWFCGRRRSRRSHGKRNGISHHSILFNSLGSDDLDSILNEHVLNDD